LSFVEFHIARVISNLILADNQLNELWEEYIEHSTGKGIQREIDLKESLLKNRR